jgi:hypothetical protein
MLLQAKKELVICGDLRSSDVFFYYTTTSASQEICLKFTLTHAPEDG